MSLTSALDTAKSSLIASQTQTSIVSRNIANVNDPNASRKYANVVTGPGGRVEIASIARSQNSILYRNMLESSSQVGRWTAITAGYQRLDEIVGDTEVARSPAALIGKLSDALLSFSNNPGSYEFGRTVTDAARDLAAGLNQGNDTLAEIRRDADVQLSLAAEDMNRLLGEIETLNETIVRGTSTGTDVTDFIDKRDAAVTALSTYVGVSSRIRGNNDLVLYTDSGVTLFETKARPVEFAPSGLLAAGAPGAVFKIDGTAVTGTDAFMPIKSGKVFGLTVLRDEITVTYQSQLDEMARGLISAFAEKDQSASATLPDAAGLFTATNPSMAGVAGRLKLSDAALLDPTLIRDGGINGSAYVYNAQNAGGFNGRILALVTELNRADRTYTASGADSKGSLADFAASSISWLQAGRAGAISETEYRSTLLGRTQETLSNETGINMAEEMTLLTDLQRSYQASAKLISTIDEMLNTLLQTL